jgi:hypothetical protein
MKVANVFTPEQLTGASYDTIRETMMGAELIVRLTKTPANEQYGESNKVANVMEYDEGKVTLTAMNSDLPG